MRGWFLKILALLAVTVWVAAVNLPDGKLHVYVCDVGQGDGILIERRTNQMIVDGGPDGKILDCLAKYMPFWDKTVEVMVATHPQADHINGLLSIANRYSVKYFVSGPEGNETDGYKALITKIQGTSSKIRNVYAGDEIDLGGGLRFKIIWPEKSWVVAHLEQPELASSQVLGAKTDGADLNGFGIVGRLTYGDFDMMLTADADKSVEAEELDTGLVRQVEVLKVPHHGSKTGMTKEWLDVVRPQLAVISVGKKNHFGHPTREALDLLTSAGARIMRTDERGTIEIVTDGKGWGVQ